MGKQRVDFAYCAIWRIFCIELGAGTFFLYYFGPKDLIFLLKLLNLIEQLMISNVVES